MAGLAGLGVGGAVGGLVGALIAWVFQSMKRSDTRTRKNGGNLLSVHCDTSDQIKRAKDLLKSSGALDIASTSESAAAGTVDEKVGSDPSVASRSRYASGGRNATVLRNASDPSRTVERKIAGRRSSPDRRRPPGVGNASVSPTPSTPQSDGPSGPSFIESACSNPFETKQQHLDALRQEYVAQQRGRKERPV